MRRPRPVTLVGLALVLGSFVALAWISLTSALVYYVTPSELASHPTSSTVRLYGIVEPGSVRWDQAASVLSFRLTDGTTTIAVRSSSLPTALFRDGIGVVISGRTSGPASFSADEVLVKHSSVYEPLRPGETPPPGLLDTLREANP